MISLGFKVFLFLSLIAVVEGRLNGGPNCNIPLNDDGCIKACLGKHHASENSFVCDISAQWMHHVGGTKDWYPATPPKGTGIHEYVAFQGTPPCFRNGHCSGCEAPQGTRICAVFIDPSDCSVTCEETNHLMEMIVTPF